MSGSVSISRGAELSSLIQAYMSLGDSDQAMFIFFFHLAMRCVCLGVFGAGRCGANRRENQ